MILPTDFMLFTDATLENGAQRVLGKTLQVWSSGFPLSNKMASKKRKRDLSEGMNIHVSETSSKLIYWGTISLDKLS